MYECPNCAANLKFDIARQKLYCMHCDTTVDPYHFQKDKDAEEQVLPEHEGDYEVTVFTCPQCGGEIISEDVTAATFCSFCGGATILDSRISRERRPEIIIPFQKTKEDCKNAYIKMMRRAIFAPSELKDELYIQKFRGIYMPYWVYDFEKKGPAVFLGNQSQRDGEDILTIHYELHCDVDEEYKGIAYDASASFSDNLSAAIAPFDMKAVKPFTPSFLSGFYADTNDVEKDLYWEDAIETVTQNAADRLAGSPDCAAYEMSGEKYREAVKNAVRPEKTTVRLALLPVWFLSYRKDDRVVYAAVNGQTGKAVADLPVDPKKYLASSFLFTVPIFILLNMFFTVTPVKILLIAAALALASAFLANRQMTHLLARESHEDDKGIRTTQAWLNRHIQDEPESGESRDIKIRFGNSEKVGIKDWLKDILLTGGFALIILITQMAARGFGRGMQIVIRMGILWMVCLVVRYVLFSDSAKAFRKFRVRRRAFAKKMNYTGNLEEKLTTLLKPLLGVFIAIFILMLHPIYDWIYYIGACACMGTVLWSFVDLIKHHNRLSTRELPQFNIRGGDM
ncbi:MAG: hypothetical protein NC126_03675 [Clostridium sp.]|nr:hypothetical protein [Clostridium sp.]